MSRAAIAAKVAGILAFVFLTNRFVDLGDRLDTLIHNFGGYRGVVIFGGLWMVCLAGILAAGFLPRLWLRDPVRRRPCWRGRSSGARTRTSPGPRSTTTRC